MKKAKYHAAKINNYRIVYQKNVFSPNVATLLHIVSQRIRSYDVN